MSNLTQDMGKYSCLFANILIPLCPEIQIEFNKITRANLTNGQLRVSRARPGSVGAGCRALWPRHVCHTLSRPRIPDTATYQTPERDGDAAYFVWFSIQRIHLQHRESWYHDPHADPWRRLSFGCLNHCLYPCWMHSDGKISFQNR